MRGINVMLMLINPYGTLFTGLDNEIDTVIRGLEKYYVLDTDDLVVETVTGEDLLVALKSGLSVEGLYYDAQTKKACIKLKWFDFSDLGRVECLNGDILFLNECLYFRGRNLHFSVVENLEADVLDKKYDLRVNGETVCTWVDESGSEDNECNWFDFVYCYLLSNYLVIRIRAFFSNTGVTVFTLIYNMEGYLIDALVTYNSKTEGLKSADPAFSAKFITLYSGRY